MDKVMTSAEIEAAFDGEWLLIEDPDTTLSQEIIEGRIMYHSGDRSESYQKLNELSPVHPAKIFVEPPPTDTVFAL